MKVGSLFPSNFLKAADLQERQITVTIDRVAMEDIGSDHKPVLYFQGKEKGLVLNKTNTTTIAAGYGDDTDDWGGGEVIIYPSTTDFQGKVVDCIRVKLPPRKPISQRAAAPEPEQERRPSRDMHDDEIPF